MGVCKEAKSAGEWPVALWTDGAAVDHDHSVLSGLTFSDWSAQEIMGVDPLTSDRQHLDFTYVNTHIQTNENTRAGQFVGDSSRENRFEISTPLESQSPDMKLVDTLIKMLNSPSAPASD